MAAGSADAAATGTVASRFQIAGDGAQRRVLVIGVQIEDRLEEHVRHAAEPDRAVAEPVPAQLRVLPAAETVLPGAGGIGVVQVALDGLVAFGDLRRPSR